MPQAVQVNDRFVRAVALVLFVIVAVWLWRSATGSHPDVAELGLGVVLAALVGVIAYPEVVRRSAARVESLEAFGIQVGFSVERATSVSRRLPDDESTADAS